MAEYEEQGEEKIEEHRRRRRWPHLVGGDKHSKMDMFSIRYHGLAFFRAQAQGNAILSERYRKRERKREREREKKKRERERE